ncbi:TATA-box-binding protein [Mizuhopecten yessoensis]|uniref:TATA-box-binding protein n=1 Tax=Mizuhopecten yessoensis TaxID=6573 RepID=A0A210PX69_MIZYE|nr:TATA-box-binding protein [Mizuhopecten yessoensis]
MYGNEPPCEVLYCYGIHHVSFRCYAMSVNDVKWISHALNVVCDADLGCYVDLVELAGRIANVRYDPRVFSGLVWQHINIGGNCLVFASGKINCNGRASSFDEGRRRLRRYARMLQRLGWNVTLTNARVVTASAPTH